MTADLHQRNREPRPGIDSYSLRKWRRGYRKDLDLEVAWQRIDELEAQVEKLRTAQPVLYLIPRAKEGE